jgi:hypothetical protein
MDISVGKKYPWIYPWVKIPTHYDYQKISMDICTLGYFKISVDITHHYDYGSWSQPE